MKQNRRTAAFIASVTFIIACVLGCAYYVYLPQTRERPIAAWAIAAVGVTLAFVLYFFVRRLPDRWYVRGLVLIMFLAIVTLPISSAWCQRINFARFGLTLYGGLPVPVLDIRVDADGWLLPRMKTHVVSRSELQTLTAGDADALVIGLGWDSVSKLSDEAKAYVDSVKDSIEVHEVSSEEAVQMYNQLQRDGKRVVLLLHSTC